mmetsp:Transcript_101382/g.285996  ORF Transcript_101382/g.285996 Transcript_101382/m.285996 type:complete len:242 (-) Transcript_101382:108-833(-)
MAGLPLLASLASRRSAAGVPTVSADAPAPRDVAASKARAFEDAPEKAPAKSEKAKVRKSSPAEVSSRRASAPPPSGKRRRVVHARDPRFDDMSGKLDMDMFGKAYAFLDDHREAEVQAMKKEMRQLQKKKRRGKSSVSAREAELMQEVKAREQQDKQRRHIGEMRSMEEKLRHDEREKVRTTGKTPFFHKKGAVRKLVLQKRKEERKGKPIRDKQEERREKKKAGKEKRKLPTRRISREMP